MINHIQFPKLGLEFTVNRVAFEVFGLKIYWYGILLTTGLVLSALVGLHLSKRFKMNQDHLLDVIMIGGIMGIVCARIYYVAFAPFEYETFWDMINIRDGGIGIYGGVIGAFVFGGLACKWRKLDVLDTADITATCFMLGQAIGRWGNFVNQEAFGTNTNSMFGMISEGTIKYLEKTAPSLARQGVVVDPYLPVHPTFLYESIWCAIGFILLYIHFTRNRKFKGEMVCLYAVWYGIGRFFIEGLRTDSLATNGGLRTSQIIAVVTVAAGLLILIYKYSKLRKSEKEKLDGKQNNQR